MVSPGNDREAPPQQDSCRYLKQEKNMEGGLSQDPLRGQGTTGNWGMPGVREIVSPGGRGHDFGREPGRVHGND